MMRMGAPDCFPAVLARQGFFGWTPTRAEGLLSSTIAPLFPSRFESHCGCALPACQPI